MKKTLLIGLIFFVVLTGCISTSYQTKNDERSDEIIDYNVFTINESSVLFSEEFNSNIRQWPGCESLGSDIRIENGQLQIGGKIGMTSTLATNVSVDSSGKYQVETIFEFISTSLDDNCSFIFYQDSSVRYSVVMSAVRYLQIIKQSGENYETTTDLYTNTDYTSPVHQTGNNKLTIRRIFGKLYCYMNAIQFAVIPCDFILGSTVGFRTPSNTKVAVESIIISSIKTSDNYNISKNSKSNKNIGGTMVAGGLTVAHYGENTSMDESEKSDSLENGAVNTYSLNSYKSNELQPLSIVVTNPDAKRSIAIRKEHDVVPIMGYVKNSRGKLHITVNGKDVRYVSNGGFESEIPYANGDTQVKITAIDEFTQTTLRFTLKIGDLDVSMSNPVSSTALVKNIPDNNSAITDTTMVTVKKEKGKRIALVIGNSRYDFTAPLKNPVNDAKLMAETLKKLGFKVILEINADKREIEKSVQKFSKYLKDYDVGLFYYAGHGLQIDSVNYLIPTDAQLAEKDDVKFQSVAMNYIMEEFERYPEKTGIVILDACRNNPYRSWVRGGEEGFKAINPPSGTIIAFATSEGATASDGSGLNGLYTEELVRQLVIPQPIESVFKKTRVEVESRSGNTQSPQEWSKLKGDFYFQFPTDGQ